MKEELYDFNDVVEFANQITSAANQDDVLSNFAFFIFSKFNPEFIAVILQNGENYTNPDIKLFKESSLRDNNIKLKTVFPIIEYFNRVEFNQLSYEDFKADFKDGDTIVELEKINPDFIVPVKTARSISGLFVIGKKKDKSKYEITEIQEISHASRFTSIALENSNLYKIATMDETTHFYSYQHFKNKLKDDILRAKRYNEKLSLIIFDLENLDKISESYGTLYKESLVRIISNRINKLTRVVDFSARYNDYRFSMILPSTSGNEALMVAKRLYDIIDENKIDGLDLDQNIKITIGIAQYDREHVETAKDIIRCANNALNKSKLEKNKKVCIGSYC